ncbi:MAG: alpha/beta fold hydrolase [Chitinophagaceae bacterium]|nr:alpha/beta fold hydrolase [Oligoflexus sp.]
MRRFALLLNRLLPKNLRFLALLFSILVMSAAAYKTAKIYYVEKVSMRSIHLSMPQKPKAWSAIRFQTQDGLAIAAWYAPTHNGATILMLHGYGNTRNQLLPEAEILRAKGFGVLMYDTRGHGESGGDVIGFGATETLDIRAALAWLEKQSEVDMTRIGGYGFSRGGFILARAAAKDRRISSLILVATPSSNFELSVDDNGGGTMGKIKAQIAEIADFALGVSSNLSTTMDAVKAMRSQSILIITSTADKTVPLARANEVFNAAQFPRRMVIFQGAEHGAYQKSDPKRFAAIITEHFESTLGRTWTMASAH